MEFRSKKKKRRSEFNEKYPHRLQLYKVPPPNGDELSLEEFEKFAADRLKLLREIENINIRFKRDTEDYNSKFRNALKQFLPYDKESADSKNQQNDRRKDHLSHFILRLAFARSEDLRRWFLTQEMELFRYRFDQESPEKIDEFLRENNLKFNAVSNAEKDSDFGKLLQLFHNQSGESIKQSIFYKVPFTDVLDLVRTRRVCLNKGFAYVPQGQLISIIIGIYRSQLSQALTMLSRKLPYLEEDTRLLPILKNLSSTYIGDNYVTKKDSAGNRLSLNDIDEASKISFPICMRNLHEGIRKEHHLKYFGRLQYGLFVKGAGLTLEESLMLWRSEFTKMMDIDKFEKQYAYNVRHSYGKEGKRADYTPYSCLKIITTNQPGTGDYHGCPFKHSDKEALRKRLLMYKVPTESINEILQLVRDQHFQVACTRYFEVTHKKPAGTASVNHPNQYFDESRKILNPNGEKKMSQESSYIKSEIKTPSTDIKMKKSKVDEEILMDDDIDMSEAFDMQ